MKTLLIVDVQNDSYPGGSLAVRDGNRLIPVINHLIASGKFDRIIASADWHPHNHISFASRYRVELFLYNENLGQIVWPDHCIAGTPGAMLRPSLDQTHLSAIGYKGLSPDKEEYSAFEALGPLIPNESELYVVGIATDYCIWETVQASIKYYPGITVFSDAVAAVNSYAEMHTLHDMAAMSVDIRSSKDFL